MPRYLSFLFLFYFILCFYFMFCFVLTSPPLMLCVYLQTFEAALFWKKKKPSLKKHIEIIENVQRMATKLVSSVSHLSYTERLARQNLPTLSYIRTRGDMIEVFKITSNIYDPKVTTFFTYRPHCYSMFTD